ncbi:glycosyltransferase [Microbacterium sp. LRZ72]|uniref:glycosyltransferase n=1 Tax=Microbacterium sp. LRZ72 TaxID=2942481 RepID=UPI0039AF3DF9
MNPFFSVVPILLWRFGFWGQTPLLVAPRGEFGDGALTRRRFKKRVYISCLRVLGIHRSVIWHSTAPQESTDIRRILGDDAVIVERTNDTLLAPRAANPLAHEGPIRLVFLGRIVPHKGLAVVLAALQDMPVRVELTVFGSREDVGYFAHCKGLASSLPRNVAVDFRGSVPPQEVVRVLHEHDVLVMPTAGENFGHVIAEALSAACVVVTTPMTPWTKVLQAGGGVVIGDRSPNRWRLEIEQLARATRSERLSLRESAAQAYDKWAASPSETHVWALALEKALSTV